MIGLSAGQSINWPCPDGRPRTLRMVDVEQSPAPPREAPNELVRDWPDRIGLATAGAGRLKAGD